MERDFWGGGGGDDRCDAGLHAVGAQQQTASGQAAAAVQDPKAAQAAALKAAADGALGHKSETHLRNIRQVTFGGQNAEAYFSADDKSLIFQHQGQFYAPASSDAASVVQSDLHDCCARSYAADATTPRAGRTLVSNGKGRTTCSYFFPSGNRILYSSTFAGNPACPPKPDYSKGYVWPIYDTYTIYTAKRDGSDIQPLSHAPGYNAESTITRDGKHIVFTSTRNGDINIYTMDADGSNVKQLTHELGYDGGPFWSYDGTKIVYRAQHPQTPAEIADYKDLLGKGLIRPGNLEIWVMNADGAGKHQVTHNGAANFAPYWLPDGKRIIFASNMLAQADPSGFDLFVINEDGTGLEARDGVSGLRCVSDVQLGRQAPGVGIQPERDRAARDEHLYRRLGGMM